MAEKESLFKKIAGKFRSDPEKKAKRRKAREEDEAHFEKEETERHERDESYRALEARLKRTKDHEHKAPSDDLIALSHISKVYSNRVEAVHDFSLDIKEGEFVVLVGPSGCGKSTTLRMIAGLEDITEGELFINGSFANKMEPRERGVSMVFQSYALYPQMSVRENMAFGLSGLSKEEKNRRIEYAAKMLSLEPYLDRRPSALSGGQNQRVALGRAIVRESPIFLLDEPLSNLDAQLRVQMRIELIKLHEKLGNTMIYVTHDQVEAMTMATKIVVMDKGCIQQVGSPEEIYSKPANVFVATFIGSPAMGVLPASIDKEGTITLPGGGVLPFGSEANSHIQESIENEETRLRAVVKSIEKDIVALEEDTGKDAEILRHEAEKGLEKAKEALNGFLSAGEGNQREIVLGLRPEEVRLNSRDGDLKFEAILDFKELLGSEFALHFLLGGESLSVYVPADDGFALKEGISFDLYVDPKEIHVFDGATTRRLV